MLGRYNFVHRSMDECGTCQIYFYPNLMSNVLQIWPSRFLWFLFLSEIGGSGTLGNEDAVRGSDGNLCLAVKSARWSSPLFPSLTTSPRVSNSLVEGRRVLTFVMMFYIPASLQDFHSLVCQAINAIYESIQVWLYLSSYDSQNSCSYQFQWQISWWCFQFVACCGKTISITW